MLLSILESKELHTIRVAHSTPWSVSSYIVKLPLSERIMRNVDSELRDEIVKNTFTARYTIDSKVPILREPSVDFVNILDIIGDPRGLKTTKDFESYTVKVFPAIKKSGLVFGNSLNDYLKVIVSNMKRGGASNESILNAIKNITLAVDSLLSDEFIDIEKNIIFPELLEDLLSTLVGQLKDELASEDEILERSDMNLKTLLMEDNEGAELPSSSPINYSSVVRTMFIKIDEDDILNTFSSLSVSDSAPLIVLCEEEEAIAAREVFEISQSAFEHTYSKALSELTSAPSKRKKHDLKKRYIYKAYNRVDNRYSNVYPEAASIEPEIEGMEIGDILIFIRESVDCENEEALDRLKRNLPLRTINYTSVKLRYTSGGFEATYEKVDRTDLESHLIEKLRDIFSISISSRSIEFSKGVERLVYGNFLIDGMVAPKLSNELLYVFSLGDVVVRNYIYVNETDECLADKTRVNFELAEYEDTSFTLKPPPSSTQSAILVECKSKSTLNLERLRGILPYIFRYYGEKYDGARDFLAVVAGTNCTRPILDSLESATRKIDIKKQYPPTLKTKIENVRKIDSELIGNYSVLCGCNQQPVVLLGDEIDEWGPIKTYEGEGKNSGYHFACSDETYKYLQHKKKEGKTYPCCFKTPTVEESAKRKSPAQKDYIKQKFVPVDFLQRGSLPIQITKTINSLFLENLIKKGQTPDLTVTLDLVRIGISPSGGKDSIIECILFAIKNEEYTNALTNRNFNECENIVKRHRSALISQINPSHYAQEFYDSDPVGGKERSRRIEDGVKKSLNNGRSFESYLHYRGLEEYFGINLFVFSKTLPPIAPVDSFAPHTVVNDVILEIPNCGTTHHRTLNEEVLISRKTVFLVSHTVSVPLTRSTYNTYEVVISNGYNYVDSSTGDTSNLKRQGRAVAASRDSEFINFPGEMAISATKVLLGQQGTAPDAIIPEFGNGTSQYRLVSQHVDMFGKARAVRIKTGGREYVVQFPPRQCFANVSIFTESALTNRDFVIDEINRRTTFLLKNDKYENALFKRLGVTNRQNIPFSGTGATVAFEVWPVYILDKKLTPVSIFSKFSSSTRSQRIERIRTTEMMFVQYFMWLLSISRYFFFSVFGTGFDFDAWVAKYVHVETDDYGDTGDYEKFGTKPFRYKYPPFDILKRSRFPTLPKIDPIVPDEMVKLAISLLGKEWPSAVVDGKVSPFSIGGIDFQNSVLTFAKKSYENTVRVETVGTDSYVPTRVFGIFISPLDFCMSEEEAASTAVFTSSEGYNSWCSATRGSARYREVVSHSKTMKRFEVVDIPFASKKFRGFGGIVPEFNIQNSSSVAIKAGGLSEKEIYEMTGSGGLAISYTLNTNSDDVFLKETLNKDTEALCVFGDSSVTPPLGTRASNNSYEFCIQSSGEFDNLNNAKEGYLNLSKDLPGSLKVRASS